MNQIAPDVHMLEDVGSAPAFLLVTGNELSLIDTGMVGETPKLIAQMEDAGFAVSDIRMIVLTHCHCDHTGGAAELAKLSGAKIAAHQDEIPYIKQDETQPTTSPLRRPLFWLFDRVYRTHIRNVDIALQDGHVVDILGGLEVIHVPGHTPGSIALYQPERQMLFSGDALCHESKAGIRSTSPFDTDSRQAKMSARKLAARPVRVTCFGHGEPIVEQAGERIVAALRQYSRRDDYDHRTDAPWQN
jgi:glyoxylase-like metal-dependent hydrolase (beta-lactamase superfamily II)